MKQQHAIRLVLLLTLTGLLSLTSCERKETAPRSRSVSGRKVQARQDNLNVLLETIATTLNALPQETVLDLVPPVPILDDSRSADGKEVLATLDVNPQDPEGGYNYLSVPTGNGNFRSLRVTAGDIVRYFIDYDQESLEHGGGVEVDYVELPVCRLDTNNPQNALILDMALNGPVVDPHRIEIWRFSDRRMNEIRLRLTRYVRQRRPAIAWEPTPDETALVQLTDRANQWFRNLKPEQVPWEPNPLLGTLPENLRQAETIAPLITPESLRDGLFELSDTRSMQEAIWLRDIGKWAKQDAYEKLDVASALFDWTIRNVQLDESGVPGIVHQPWQALIYGHATAEQRAWVFAGLCLQQQLDVVMLSFDTEDGGSQWWLPALLIDDQLYLFDTRLGLPLTNEEGQIATLEEVVANPNLLRTLDLDEEHPYPVTAEDLDRISASLVATPLQLSRRAAALQGALQGEDYVVLAAPNPNLLESLKKVSLLADIRLWAFPFEVRLAEESMKRPQREQAAQQILSYAQRPRLGRPGCFTSKAPNPFPSLNKMIRWPSPTTDTARRPSSISTAKSAHPTKCWINLMPRSS